MSANITDEDIEILERIVANYERVLKKFVSDTNTESDLQTILRAHLYIEHELESLLNKQLVHPEILSKRLRFVDKVKIVFAMGILPKEEMSTIIEINNLRNKYAHELEFVFTEIDFNKMFDSFSKIQTDKYYNFLKGNIDLSLSKKLKVALFTTWMLIYDQNNIPKELKWKLEKNKKILEERKMNYHLGFFQEGI